MSPVILYSLAAVAALVFGLLSARAIAALPLDVLARASNGGRYAGLGAAEAPAPAAPSHGIPTRPAMAA
ncbi:MAG: hypothetical protein JSR54_01820 [Proteobacteria bacterium]|nr:hypothetical protein [Pseudomonadota bacterium]